MHARMHRSQSTMADQPKDHQRTNLHANQFVGFDVPRENWFRLPNEWTDVTAKMRSWAEHKIVEYVLSAHVGFSGICGSQTHLAG